MSQMTALRAPRTSKSTSAPRKAQRPRLRIVQPADTPATGGVAFAVGCMFLLVCGLVTVLLLNTVRAQQSFTLDKLGARSQVLADQQQALSSDLQRVSAPQQLALKAEAMGMRPANKVRYVRASDGKVLGVAKAPSGGAPFTVGTLPTTPASRAGKAATAAATSGIVKVEHKPATKAKKASKSTDRPAAKDSDKAKDKATSKSDSSGAKSATDKRPSSTDTSSPKKTNPKQTKKTTR